MEITATEAAGAMLGGEAIMNLGILIAGWYPKETGNFTAAQLTNVVDDVSPSAIARTCKHSGGGVC